MCVDFNAPYDQKTGACYDMLMFRLAYDDGAMKLEPIAMAVFIQILY